MSLPNDKSLSYRWNSRNHNPKAVKATANKNTAAETKE